MNDDAEAKYGHLWERFFKAAEHLAGARGRVQERLEQAWSGYLLEVGFENHPATPEGIRAKLNEYEAALAKQPVDANGQIHAWIAGMSEDEACDVANWIFNAFLEIMALYNPDTA
ncbi:MAG: hypothetical protein WEC75_01195 [Dehalococcoidia bacterium]